MADQKKRTPTAADEAAGRMAEIDPSFSAVDLGRSLQERVSFACGATGLPEPLTRRAQLGERRALRLLSKLVERRSRELAESVVVTGEEIACLLAGRPMSPAQANRRFRELSSARTEGDRGRAPKVDERPREFPERLAVVDLAPSRAALSELQILPENENTDLPTATYVRLIGSGA